MPAEARYSLFPPSDDVLQAHSAKRLTARPKTPTGGHVKRQPSMRTIREEGKREEEEATRPPSAQADAPSVKDTASRLKHFSEAPTERQSQLPYTDPVPSIVEPIASTSPVEAKPRPSVEHKTHSPVEPKTQSPVEPKTQSPVEAQVQSPVSSPASPPPTRPLPGVPGATSAPKARAPALKTTAPSPSSASPQQIQTFDFAWGHARSRTNESASTATTAFKPSPISPESLTSPASIFSPITPASDATSISYPSVPKLSSSPAPSIYSSPPRRSNTRASSSASTAYTHHQSASRSSDAGTRSVSAGIRRSPSAATSRTGKTDPPYRSLFPTFNPALPLAQQDYRPAFAAPGTARPLPQSRPSLDASTISSSSHSSTSRLTAENLRAHESSSSAAAVAAASAPRHPPRSTSVPPLASPPTTTTPAPQPAQPTSAPADAAPPPTFDPPPTTAGAAKSKSKPKPKPKKADKPPRTKVVLAKRPKKGDLEAVTFRSTTTAVTRFGGAAGELRTTATTTLLGGWPDDKAKGQGRARSLSLDEKAGAASRWTAPTHASDVPDAEGPVPEGMQHGVTVALGAMAFVMGVGVEAMGGLRRKKAVA